MGSTENSNQERPENHDSNGGNKIFLVVIVILLLLATNVFLLWQFFTKKTEIITLTETTHVLSNQKDSLKADLDKTVLELNSFRDENLQLKGKLNEAESSLEQKKNQVEKMIRSGELVQAKRALANLKLEIETFKGQIDSLKQANSSLQAANLNLNSNLSEEKTKNSSLSQENNNLSTKVAAGSVLKASVSKVIAIKVKSNGKEIEVSRAKAAQKIKACFTLMENKLTEAGPKTIYMRVIGPTNSVLSENNSNETIKINGQASKFSAKEDIQYDNKDMEICMYYTSQNSTYSQNINDLVKGDYKIEIYSGGALIGKSQISLK